VKNINIIILSLFLWVGAALANVPSIVPLDWLKSHLGDKNLVIVDVRDRDIYLKGHIKGAVNIPANAQLFRGKKLMMPKLSHLQKIFSDAGIDQNSEVVSYDGGLFYFSARLHWLLEVLGHKNVGILAVSYGNWKKGEIAVDLTEPKVKKANFIPQVDSAKIATKLDVLVSLGKVTLIDGRRASDYEGKTSSVHRFGHIPTAINFPSTLTYTKSVLGSKMKDWSKLKDVFKNIKKNKKVILYCDDSAEAAMDGLILDKLGYHTVVYEGSWLEWGDDDALPIVNPAKKKK